MMRLWIVGSVVFFKFWKKPVTDRLMPIPATTRTSNNFVKIELKNDEMIIHGGSEVKGTKVHSHHDHRIAMALAVAALKANGETIIEEAQAVKKSYPDFYNDLKTLGASVSLPYQLFN